MTDVRPLPTAGDPPAGRPGDTSVEVRGGVFAVRITATTRIDAPAPTVWGILVDTAAYPSWNPFVRRLEGRLAVGERITVAMKPADDEQVLHPRVVEVDPGRSFSWLGRVGIPGVLDGRHTFTVQPDGPGGCVLVQDERLSGALVPFFRSMLTRDTPRAFAALNDALAARAARRSG